MPKHFLNNSKTTSKKSRKRLFRPKKWDLQSKFCPLWRFWGVIFGHFRGRKSRFLDFFQVVLELFRKCLGIVFDLKRPTFGGILTLSHTLCYPYLLLSFGAPRSPKKCRQGFKCGSSCVGWVWVWSGVVWVWGVFTSKIFMCLKSSFDQILFFKCF